MKLANKIALITGAGSGMGRATAEVFAAVGAHVAVTDFNETSAKATADAIAAQGGSAKAWALDVTDASRIRFVVDEIVQAWGGLDIVVAPAGVAGWLAISIALAIVSSLAPAVRVSRRPIREAVSHE